MIPWKLIPRQLLAHPLRSVLTAGSVTFAVFLVCTLRVLVVSLGSAVDAAVSERLIAQSSVSLFVNLPEAYQAKIDNLQIDGRPAVAHSTKYNWFGGVYQNDENFFGQFSCDPDKLLETYPELEVVDGSAEAFVANRTGCLVGQDLVERFPEFEVGAKVPLIGRLYARNDGSEWQFTIEGIYRSTSDNHDSGTMFFHHDYLRESLEAGDAVGPEGVSVFSLLVAEGVAPERVQSEVDDLFAASDQRVQTTTEAEFNRQFVTMLGNVPTLMTGIGGGVVFAILLAVLNTMLMAARERTQQMGVLKALGFTDATAGLLLLVESLVLCLAGGLVGLFLSFGAIDNLPTFVKVMIPSARVSLDTIGVAVGGSVALGLIAAALPALQLRRLRPVEAFRRGA